MSTSRGKLSAACVLMLVFLACQAPTPVQGRPAAPKSGRPKTVTTGGGRTGDRDEIDSSQKFLIPYLTGLGVNNQIWQYLSAMHIAKATNRTLCLVPWIRFYLSAAGRPSIDFDELFDPARIGDYARVADMTTCWTQCKSGRFNGFYSTQGPKLPCCKAGKEAIYERAFMRNTGFHHGIPKLLTELPREALNSMDGVRRLMAPADKDRCIGFLGSMFDIPPQNVLALNHLTSATSIQDAAAEATRRLFGGEYVAVHWRFEETKCREAGLYLPPDRSRPSSIKNMDQLRTTKAGYGIRGSWGDFCFFTSLKGYVVRSLTIANEQSIFDGINRVKSRHGLRHVFLSTDIDVKQAAGFLKRLRAATGVRMLSDLDASFWQQFHTIDRKQSDVMSRLEQEICIRSKSFVGTSTSSWTGSVLQGRLPSHITEALHTQRIKPENLPYYLTRKEDTYIDMEVCSGSNCELSTEPIPTP
ncbi:hypothetical protein CYMTET_19456 [Cymbomonas tetramitiformis]|uniref:GDP-fucose protein O-fucosyltransferase 2 n=1 Tax=Cymbomonas tetramitiformis TaxID=36881 RepID=A0AAE0L574_9CHLO|nr:hypothetical protein CYMTET_19456 [Cymbomonas tetramitiformis]